MFQNIKARWSRSRRSQPARDASQVASRAGASFADPLPTPTSPPISISNALGGSEPAISLTNALVIDPHTNSAPVLNTNDAASAPVCVTEPSTRRVENRPSAMPSKPSGEGDEHRPFVRLAVNRTEDELKMLDYSCAISNSSRLCLAVKAVSNLAELIQESGSEADRLCEIAELSSGFIISLVEVARDSDGKAALASDPMISEFSSVVEQISQKLHGILRRPSDIDLVDSNEDKRIAEKCLADLQAVIHAIKSKYPSLSQRDHTITTEASTGPTILDSSSRITPILGKSTGLLKILNEAAELAPVPFLKGSISTVLVLLQTARTTRLNREDMLRLAAMAGDFVTSIRAACDQPGRLESRGFRTAVHAFTEALNKIVQKCQTFSNRSLISRLVSQDGDKDEILDCKSNLQHAIRAFNMQATILHQNALQTILVGQGTIMTMLDCELLDRLPRAPLSFAKQEYLASSRTDELNRIVDWIENSAADKRVFWLRGAAGMGKSTLSSHLRNVFGRTGRLAAYFFFSRNDQKQEDPGFIIGTLAYQLAHVDHDMGNVICNAIRSRCPDQQFSSQFQAWVLNPLLVASLPLPMVIILDALDEYKDIVHLLDVLIELVPKMPPNIKLFLTSRPESPIETRIRRIQAEELGLYPATDGVMEAFFREQLGSVEGWQSMSPSQDQISRLVDAAQGHFAWAATACNVIARPSNGFPDDIVEQILSPRPISPHSAEARLDSLYHGVLSQAFPDGPDSRPSLENYRRVLGAILVVEAHLNISDLQAVLGKSARVNAIVSDLRGLQTQISSDPTLDCPVTPASERFHASFLDFIVNPERCMDGLLRNADRFCINVRKSHTYVAQACLQRMAEFFESEQGRTALYANIPGALRYAMDHWASHVYGSEVISDTLRRAVTDFSDCNFVHWFRIQIQSMRGDDASDFIPNLDPNLDVAGRLHYFTDECHQHPEYIMDVRQLDMIISVQDMALRLAADDHPHRDDFMRGMGCSLRRRFRRVSRVSDLDAALKFNRKALTLCPHGHPHRRISLQTMTYVLYERFHQMGAPPDLNEAISMWQEALELASDSHQRYTSLCDLAFALYRRYEENRDPQDLKDANTMTQEAGPLRKTSDLNHAFLILKKYTFRADDDIQDPNELNGVIDLLREHIKSTPAMHPRRPLFLHTLALVLHTQFKSTNQLHDLDEAIDLRRGILRSTPATHPDRSLFLNDLADALDTRFNSTGQLGDVDEAIELGREAVKSIPVTNPH